MHIQIVAFPNQNVLWVKLPGKTITHCKWKLSTIGLIFITHLGKLNRTTQSCWVKVGNLLTLCQCNWKVLQFLFSREYARSFHVEIFRPGRRSCSKLNVFVDDWLIRRRKLATVWGRFNIINFIQEMFKNGARSTRTSGNFLLNIRSHVCGIHLTKRKRMREQRTCVDL